MTKLIRYLILNVLGLLLAAFGVYTAANSYPSTGELAAWSKALPTLKAMLAFGLSVAAVIAGVAMLAPLVWRRRRQPGRSAASTPPMPTAAG